MGSGGPPRLQNEWDGHAPSGGFDSCHLRHAETVQGREMTGVRTPKSLKVFTGTRSPRSTRYRAVGPVTWPDSSRGLPTTNVPTSVGTTSFRSHSKPVRSTVRGPSRVLPS